MAVSWGHMVLLQQDHTKLYNALATTQLEIKPRNKISSWRVHFAEPPNFNRTLDATYVEQNTQN